jgi:hypothetical protein
MQCSAICITLPGELAVEVAMETTQWIASLCIETENTKPIIALQQMRFEKEIEKRKTHTQEVLLPWLGDGSCTGMQESGSDNATLARLTLPMCEEFWHTRAVTAPITWRSIGQ